MEKKKITVYVAGNKLTLITTEEEKYVTDIATKVDTAINSMAASTNMSKERCAVMCALDYCDDMQKAKDALVEIKEQIKDYIEDSANLRAENESLKAQIAKLSTQEATTAKTEEKVEVAVKAEQEPAVSAEDDLSFDNVVTQTLTAPKPTEEKVESASVAPQNNYNKPQGNSNKKRHEHKHTNPFRERFMNNSNSDNGYRPQRQYSLFDKKD